MKHLIITVLTLFFALASTKADVNYYYYNHLPVNLEQRDDKIAVITDNTSFTVQNISERIKSRLGSADTVKIADENVLVITLSGSRLFSRVNSTVQTLQSIPGIKFITKTYYGSSKRVTQVPTDEFIVRVKDEKYTEALNRLNAENRCIIIGNVGDKKGFLVKSLPGVNKNALELSDIYYNSSIFEFAEPNFLYPEFCLLHYSPNDTYFSSQWALNNTAQNVPTGGVTGAGDGTTVNGLAGADMRLNQAWDYTLGSSSIEVGVFDTGIDSTHPDFQSPGHLLPGYDGYYNTSSA